MKDHREIREASLKKINNDMDRGTVLSWYSEVDVKWTRIFMNKEKTQYLDVKWHYEYKSPRAPVEIVQVEYKWIGDMPNKIEELNMEKIKTFLEFL